MALPVTAFYAGLLALWVLFLATRVIRFRWSARVSLGDGGHSEGQRLIRGHANAIETVPLFLILLALAEGMGSAHWFLHILGAGFTIGRVLHGAHFVAFREARNFRVAGMALTLLTTAVAALDLIRHSLI